jgi:hypothetical protein
METAAVERRRLERVRRCFDATGRLQRWPNKRAEQLVVLWIVWSQLPDDTRMSEAEFSSLLGRWHDYEDYALLRRELFDLGLVQRTQTGSIYRKVSRDDVPPDAAAAIATFDET